MVLGSRKRINGFLEKESRMKKILKSKREFSVNFGVLFDRWNEIETLQPPLLFKCGPLIVEMNRY